MTERLHRCSKCTWSWWWCLLLQSTSFAALLTTATADVDAEPTQQTAAVADDYVTEEISHHEAAARKSTCETVRESTGEPLVDKPTAGCGSVDEPAETACNDDGRDGADKLRAKVMQLTNGLSKAIATLTIAQRREQKLTVLEREKYGYVKVAAEKVSKLADNVQNVKAGLARDTCREQQIQQQLARIYRMLNRSSRRLQVIRRLLTGAEVGLVYMESNRVVNSCNPDPEKCNQSGQEQK